MLILFQITKIQNFETNSQRFSQLGKSSADCFRSQRYKILKPIHNRTLTKYLNNLLFQITKIQNFETNSQHTDIEDLKLKTVSDHKDTKF